jgi:hypothetical protein
LGTIRSICLVTYDLGLEIGPCLIGLCVARAELERPAKSIQRLKLSSMAQQRLLFMLTVDVDESSSEFFKRTEGTQVSVHVDTVTTGTGEDTPQNQLGVVRADDPMGPQLFEQGMRGGEMKGRLKLGFLFTGTDLIGRGTTTNQKTYGIDEEGLPGSGLAGQDGVPGLELKAEMLNQREVGNTQLSEHCGGSRRSLR